MRDCLFLVKNGVPFDVAFQLPPAKRMAFVVIFGEMNGQRFDWANRTFRPLPTE